MVSLVLAMIILIPEYYTNNIIGSSVCFWLLLFFGAGCVPTLQGIIVCDLPPDLRASGNSLCNLFIFGLAWSLSPIFYGGLFDKLSDNHLPMTLSCSIGAFGLLFSSIIACIKYSKN